MIHFNYTKILIPVDFSDTSMLAIRHGAYISQHTGAQIYLLHVVNAHFMSQNMFLPVVNLDQGLIETKASEKLSQLGEEISSKYKVNVQTIIRTGSPSSEVVKVAR